MLSGSRRKATAVDFEQAMEDDGVLALTFWFAGDGRPYLSMCCSEEGPGSVYIESEDQIYGFETTQLAFSFESGSVLVLRLMDGTSFPATTVNRLEIEFHPDIQMRLRERLEKMMSEVT
jgi:hypothetical protein